MRVYFNIHTKGQSKRAMAPRPLIVACERPLLDFLRPDIIDDDVFPFSSPICGKILDTTLDVILGDKEKPSSKKKQKSEVTHRLAKETDAQALMPRRVDKEDSVEWHLRGHEWMRPEDVQMNLDVPKRRLELCVRREDNTKVPCAKHSARENQEKTEDTTGTAEQQEDDNCPDCSTFSSLRQMKRAFTLPEEIDLDKLQANLSSDRSAFVLSAPLKRKREPANDAPVPIKIIRK